MHIQVRLFIYFICSGMGPTSFFFSCGLHHSLSSDKFGFLDPINFTEENSAVNFPLLTLLLHVCVFCSACLSLVPNTNRPVFCPEPIGDTNTRL